MSHVRRVLALTLLTMMSSLVIFGAIGAASTPLSSSGTTGLNQPSPYCC